MYLIPYVLSARTPVVVNGERIGTTREYTALVLTRPVIPHAWRKGRVVADGRNEPLEIHHGFKSRGAAMTFAMRRCRVHAEGGA